MSYNYNYTVFTGPIIFFRWQFFQLFSLQITHNYDDTSDYTVTIQWEASVISNGPFRQSDYNVDH